MQSCTCTCSFTSSLDRMERQLLEIKHSVFEIAVSNRKYQEMNDEKLKNLKETIDTLIPKIQHMLQEQSIITANTVSGFVR